MTDDNYRIGMEMTSGGVETGGVGISLGNSSWSFAAVCEQRSGDFANGSAGGRIIRLTASDLVDAMVVSVARGYHRCAFKRWTPSWKL